MIPTCTYPFFLGFGRVTTPLVDRNLPLLETCGHFNPFVKTHCLISPGFALKAGLEILEIPLSFDKPLLTLVCFIDQFGTFSMFHYSKSEMSQSLGKGFGVMAKTSGNG